MTKIFKRSIEKESKIENKVQILYTDVLESELIRNFKKPKVHFLRFSQLFYQQPKKYNQIGLQSVQFEK